MGLTRRVPAGGGTGGDATVTSVSINQALSSASVQQIDQLKSYLKISGFDYSCYDFRAIQENPPNIDNKILDAGADDV